MTLERSAVRSVVTCECRVCEAVASILPHSGGKAAEPTLAMAMSVLIWQYAPSPTLASHQATTSIRPELIASALYMNRNRGIEI